MRVTPVLALAAATAVLMSACSSSKNGDPVSSLTPSVSTGAPTSSDSPSTPSSPTDFPSSTSSSSSSSSPASGAGLTEAQANGALLSAAEVGGGFTTTPPDTTSSPLPCTPNDPPLDEQIPPAVNVEADFTGASGNALFSEQIETYADEATIASAIAGGEKGLGCKTAKLGNATATIDGPTDLTTQLKSVADKAEAWVVKSSVANVSLIVAKLGTTLAVFQFTAAPTVDTTNLPNIGTVVGKGLAKLAAAN